MGAIRIENLSKKYRNKQIFDNFGLKVEEGEIHGIKGRTGIGKTTLMRCIAGLEDFSGTIETNGEVSYLFQDSRLLPWKNIRENILMPFKLQGRKITEEEIQRMHKLARQFDIEKHLDKQFNQVSGGQKQKALQVRSLVTDPDILLLDEPFKSHDTHTRLKAYKEIINICKNEQKSVVLSSHHQDMEKVTDRVLDFHKASGVSNLKGA